VIEYLYLHCIFLKRNNVSAEPSAIPIPWRGPAPKEEAIYRAAVITGRYRAVSRRSKKTVLLHCAVLM
jgi:nitroimidazol reductase NimA-like FMN-containing flavoprotein (pyridoxamine 5'-phosphate oxidase superfamily)